ncbi:MAG: double-strand break repair helicase AddA [Pseudomonadota bacterium]
MAESAYDKAALAQAIAADPSLSAWVSANAGSGKTKVLIDRVARLLLNGANPDSILCITYTKAAANEMLERLFQRLGSWSVMEEPKLREELVTLEGRSNNPHTAEEIRRARALFARAVETPGGLRIETIHAFCSRVLRRFPLEARLAPGFQEVEDDEAAELWNEAARKALVWANEQAPDALDVLSKAGGGFGAMAGIEAIRDNIIGLTKLLATNEDWDERLRMRLNIADTDTEALLQHAMEADFPIADLKEAASILEADGAADSRRTALAIRVALGAQTRHDRWEAYRTVVFTGGGKPRARIYNSGAKASPLIVSLFDPKGVPQGSEVLRVLEIDRQLKAIRIYQRTMAMIALARPVLSEYQNQKRFRAAVDFDDLIARTKGLLTQSAAADWVLYKLDGGLTHVLLDEAQDTSPDQWELINALVTEFFAGEGVEKDQDPRTLFVVGDEKQSIYSFQGADPQRFIEERQVFEGKSRAAFGDARLPDMAMSFRSCPEILQFVDQVSESGDVDGHPFIDGPVGDFDIMRHTAFRAKQSGCVELWPVDPPDPLEPDIPWDAPRDTQSGNTPKSLLATKVAHNLADIIRRGERVWSGGRRRAATPGDILILVQNRGGGLFDALIAALKAEGLPVAGADRLVLADHIGVQDCLNLIRFVLLPEDDLTLAEILRGPFGGLVDDDEHLFPLAYDRGSETLWQRLQSSTKDAHNRVAKFLAGLIERADLAPFEFLSGILECPDADNLTGWQKLISRLGKPAVDPISALLAKAISHDTTGAASLQSFMSAMELDRSDIKRDLAAANGEIRIMTVHGAKGLQAPIVVLPDLTRAQSPGRSAILPIDGLPIWAGSASDDVSITEAAREAEKARQLREHRRLLYVALTRAEDRLILAGHWYGQRPKPNADPGPGYPKASWYALCAEAMETLTGSTIADGDVIRFGAEPSCAEAPPEVSPTSHAAPDWLTRPAPPEPTGDQLIAASAVLQDESPVLPPADTARAVRLKRGRLIHALLERLPELEADKRRQVGDAFLKRDTALSEDQRADMLDAAMTVLEDPRFSGVFAPGGRAEAPIIGTGQGLPAGRIINGRVDRLVVTDDKVLIVDYKTDRPAPADVTGVSRAYLAQMAAYRAVLQNAYGDKDVEAALVWTDGPVLMPLPNDLLEESLPQSSFAV